MKVVHTVMSISRKAGGLQGAVLSLGRALLRERSSVQVLGLADEFSSADEPMWAPLRTRSLPTVGPAAFGYAPRLLTEMIEHDPDVVHCHGLWLYPSLATLRWRARTGRPYVVSPHGMLEREVEMRQSRLKKAWALRLYQGRHLREAACLHALCEAELRDIRAMGLRNPVCVIPNGVEPPAPDPDESVPAPWGGGAGEGRKTLLYLGRVARKKGLTELLRALALVRDRDRQLADDWRLVVVGWEIDNHRAELEQLAGELRLGESVRLVGPLFGEGKAAAYRNADAFVLPSMSEGLPLVVPEAWSYGLPVLMTPQCNLPEGEAAGAAICAEPSPEALAAGLARLFGMGDAELGAMGARGRALAGETFSWPRIGAQMTLVYEWLTRGGTPPATVRLAA